MISELNLSKLDHEDEDVIMDGLRAELEHALMIRRRSGDPYWTQRANRIAALMSRIDGHMRPILKD